MTRLPSHCASVRVLLPKPAVGVSAESEEDDAMAVSWRVSGRVLVVTEAGVNANHEIGAHASSGTRGRLKRPCQRRTWSGG